MGVLFSPEFWPDPLAIALKASAIVIPLLVLAFWVGWKLKGSINDREIRALRMQKKLADEQVNAAGQAAARQAQPIANIQARLADLEGAVADFAPLSAIQPILERLLSDVGAVATANSTILRALLKRAKK